MAQEEKGRLSLDRHNSFLKFEVRILHFIFFFQVVEYKAVDVLHGVLDCMLLVNKKLIKNSLLPEVSMLKVDSIEYGDFSLVFHFVRFLLNFSGTRLIILPLHSFVLFRDFTLVVHLVCFLLKFSGIRLIILPLCSFVLFRSVLLYLFLKFFP